MVLLIIWIGANTIAIRKNTVRSVENSQSIDSLTALQEQSEKNSQLIITMLERLIDQIDEQGEVLMESTAQMKRLSEQMGVSNE